MFVDKFHIPVLSQESIKLLINPAINNPTIVDGTLGGGGYTKIICEVLGDNGKVISIDKDLNAIEFAKNYLKEYESKIIFLNGNFGEIKELLDCLNIGKISGLVLDLGLSSFQLEAEDGFSFMKDTLLDMRAYKKDSLTARDVVNSYEKESLINIFEEYGEIGNAERLVKAIIIKRRMKEIKTTFDLVELVKEEYDLNQKNQIDFLAKIFQSLRIEVNDELKNLEAVLKDSIELVERGGRIVMVSYHSLEDRIVKNFFKEESSKTVKSDNPYGNDEKIPRLKILTKKPIVPSFEEIKFNSRSRSAKLRAAEII